MKIAAISQVLLVLFCAAPAATETAPPEMLQVPGGSFTMGADGVGESDEQPAHRVSVPSFWLDRTEVTNSSYLECVHAEKCAPFRDDVARRFGAGPEAGFRGAEQPVVGVSFVDASRYCEFRGKRLPREIEWERAARGDDDRIFAWGNEKPTPQLACYGRKPGAKGATTDAVGSHPSGAGPYGHLDLTGNVWEWTADIYDPFAYRREGAAEGIPGSCEQVLETQNLLRKTKQQGFTGHNPIPVSCERVLRGGAFNYDAAGLRASNRVHHPETWRMLVAGFRCAKDI
ncbi:MAG TPA: formylglycine-generating enzyme family protein [Polyangiaceae bacterium]|nr:formylglycine-generating enzyme family protein [Polyangiaceae bacterium]